MHLERSEVFKGALLKVEPLPRVGVGRVLRGDALVQTGQKIESQGWTLDRCFFLLIIILNYLFFIFLWPGVPGEASVGTRIGENRLPAGRGKPRRLLGSQDRGSRIGSLSSGIWYDKVKNLQDKQCGRTYKEVFGRSGPPLPGSDNPC